MNIVGEPHLCMVGNAMTADALGADPKAEVWQRLVPQEREISFVGEVPTSKDDTFPTMQFVRRVQRSTSGTTVLFERVS